MFNGKWNYTHGVAAELGVTGYQKDAKRKGFLVHSVLLLDAVSETTVGLIEQDDWCREPKDYGKKHARKQRAYEDKESHKWEQASQRTAQRLGATMARTISVCDRESDVVEYLDDKRRNAQRFRCAGRTSVAGAGMRRSDMIRAKVDRPVCASDEHLFETLARDAVELSCYTVNVAQRGGRPLLRIPALRGTCTSVCGAKRVRPPCTCAVCGFRCTHPRAVAVVSR